MERRHVLLQELGLVTLRVDGDEKHLELVRVRTERLGDGRELGKRGRAGVWTVREAEEYDDDLALEVGKRAALARVIREIELLAPRSAGDVGELELGGGALGTARGEKRAREQGKHTRPSHAPVHGIREVCGSNDRRAARRRAPTGT